MKVIPHLTFDGQCEAAFRFYEQCLGGRIVTMLRWRESPMAGEAPAGAAERILHATLEIGDAAITGADALPGKYDRPQGFFVLLNADSIAAAERVFQALSDEGSVRMPLQQTFWAARFGMLVDRFGVPWEIQGG
jgi:PhnB protein